MLQAPINLMADGCNYYYSQCWRCRNSAKLTTAKRRKLNIATTSSLVESPGGSPSLGPFSIIRRQQAQAESVANLRNLFNLPPLALSASPSLSTLAGTGSTLPNINVQMLAAPAVLAPAPTLRVEPSTLTTTSTSESKTFLLRGKDSNDTPKTAAARTERGIVQRDHRRRERGGEEVSLTLGLSQFRHPYRYDEGTGSPLTPPPPSSQVLTLSGVQGRPFLPFD
jgi:hypothetical protein